MKLPVRVSLRSVWTTSFIVLGLLMASCGGDHSANLGVDGPSATANLPPSAQSDPAAGQAVFRFETFGNEGFWTDALQLQQGLIAAAVTPIMALKLGLSIDSDALDAATLAAISAELKTELSPANASLLNSPATTVALVNANAVIGLVPKDSNGDGVIDITKGDKTGATCALSHFLYSRLMCWVAIDRAHRLAVRSSLPARLVRWARVRDEIHADIIDNFWDESQGAFVQARGEKALDGSTFLLANLHFLSPTDPKWLSTHKALEAQLVEEPFVYRYRPELVPQDDMKGIEGAFAACSFGYVEALARGGQTQKARRVFEGLLGSANHLGLYAEQFGAAGEQLGNFPQALTHLTLIMAAVTLDAALNAARHAA